MIFSMTGFGRGEVSDNGLSISAELRTLNNRYFDFGFRAPRTLIVFEAELRELCRKSVERGKISLTLSENRAGSTVAARIDFEAARRVSGQLKDLCAELQIQEAVHLDHLLQFPEVITPVDPPEVAERLLSLSMAATEKAIENLRTMRQQEGEVLTRDMLGRLDLISGALSDVKQAQEGLPTRALEKLKDRVQRLVANDSYDENRLELELALIADRLDITEECVRLDGHLNAFRKTLTAPSGQVGKRLGFLLQEMNREANTIASKTSSLEVSHLTVSIREEIERLREQVQNLE
ncbi:MAG: YicC family protein [Calditrichaeota bacterium]|nr:YicC family protein [Calditrichota bacterium]MCB9391546.1 YicC family protein [Calditrichota bacterium]